MIVFFVICAVIATLSLLSIAGTLATWHKNWQVRQIVNITPASRPGDPLHYGRREEP